MAWGVGPGELTSIAFGGTTVTADLIDGYSLTNTKDSYDSGLGHPIDRGSIQKRLVANVYDVSAINAIHTLMTGRTESTVTVTYSDSNTQALNECIIRVKPLLQNVSDVCKVWEAASGTANTSLTSNWDDCGVTLDVPTLAFDYQGDFVDGKGRPYFSQCKQEITFMLPGDEYATFTEGAQARIAFALADGNFQVMDGRTYINYGDEDMTRPRVIQVTLRGVGADWGDLIEFTDGTASPTTEDFDASSPTLIQDKLHGIEVEVVGFGYAESDVTTF